MAEQDLTSYRGIIAQRFPAFWEGRPGRLRGIPSGWDSFVLEVDGEYIFRFPLREDVRARQRTEAVLLPELSRWLTLPIPFPEFINLDGPELGGCFLGYRKIEGQPLEAEFTHMPSISPQIGLFLSELHGLPIHIPAIAAISDLDQKGWKNREQEFFSGVQARVLPLLKPPQRKQLRRVWEGYLENQVNFSFPPAVIHCDLGEEHILCDPNRQSVTGVIDWGDVTVGDPAMDFVGLYSAGGIEFVKKVLKNYSGSVDVTFLDRMMFYFNAIPIHEILYGLYTNDDDYVHQGLTRLTKILAGTAK